MAILIKSMDMPTECEYCGFCRYYPENGNVWCNARNRLLKMNWENPHWTHLDVKRPDWCPLEALPSAQPEQCDYCIEDSDGYVKPIEKNSHAFVRFGMDGWELSLKAKGWHGSAKIRYCPMCGRRLERG